MIGLNEENEAQHLGTPAVARRYDKTTRTIDRWAEDPDLGFPKPM